MLNNMSLDRTKNKVYINPNFNKHPISSSGGGAMHVNPRFSHLLSNNAQSIVHSQPHPQNTAKIYVNPNFMKNNTAVQCIPNKNTNHKKEPLNIANTNTMLHYDKQPVEGKETMMTVPITKSRYSLVRQNVNKELDGPVVGKLNTIQVSKYKSIPLNDIKKKLDYTRNKIITCHNDKIHASSTNKNYLGPSTSYTSRSIFKLKDRNKTDHETAADRSKVKISSNIMVRKTAQMKIKKLKGNLKKNNIPCPMFRKFGKCLRQMQGKCEFLHDKKHVSICRKFIKGLCHDKQCLLSHDLSSKKMPTCYFYLQGTCTKLDCPYLHVKLSEKVKICPDFLKGYCEKGGKCLQRHVNMHCKKSDGSSAKDLNVKKKYSKVRIKNVNPNVVTILHDDESIAVTEIKSNNLERYYQEQRDDQNASTTCEVIKPLRCKLGTLPSFIQL